MPDIILTGNGKTVVFPVLPSSYSVKTSQNNTSVTINAIGEVNLLGKSNLEEVTFSSFFPHAADTYTSGSVRDPMEYVEDIRSMKEAGPCKLHLLDVQAMHCTIEEFDFSEDDGTGDIKFDITLKQYRYISVKGLVQKKIGRVGRQAAAPKDGASYVVKKGDTLFTIARKQLGTTDWKELYSRNKDVIGDNPNRLKEGTKLTLPG